MTPRRARRAIILAVAALSLIGSDLASPGRPAGAVSAPGDLLVFYGWPSAINGAATSAQAAAELGRYDFVVLGTGVEDPSHPDHARTAAVLADPAMAGTFVFGYVALGGSGGNSSLEGVRARIDWWQALGADGVMLDEFGYDFGNTRERQNAAVDYAHGRGLPVLANAWFPADAFDSAPDPNYNPAGLPPRLGAGDFYLFESHRVMLGEYVPEDVWRAKAEAVAAYRSRLGFSVLSVTTNDADDTYSQEQFFASWQAAAAYGHAATGWGEYLFSADDGLAPFRARPTDPAPAPANPPPPPADQGPAPDMGGQAPADASGDAPGPASAACAGWAATIVGTGGPDTLVGTDGRDVIAGLGGDDLIEGLGGDDLICGGAGADILRGGEGADWLVGGGGADRMEGGAGADSLRGNQGDDQLSGGPGDDRLFGGGGSDRLSGGPGDDRLFGQQGDDLLLGDAGADRAAGGAGQDACRARITLGCES